MESIVGSNTSVFVGSFVNDYNTMMSRANHQQQTQRYQAVGNHSSLLANRLSWFYDLKGPSMAIDTACSSSLNAVHIACQSLRSGESTMVKEVKEYHLY
jgi:acyl transferase domain-containing protein